MISQTIQLSSNSSSTLVVSPTAYMYDTTTFILDTQLIYTEKPPISLTIRWGDDTADEFYTNDFFSDDLNIVNEIAFGYDYTVIQQYSHQYSPSTVALTKILSAQVLVNYFDNTACRFIVPINITNPSLANKVGELDVLSVNTIGLSGDYLVSLHASKGGFVIDTVLSV